jgi:hypothetical protein
MKMTTLCLAIVLCGTSGAAFADRGDGARGDRDDHGGFYDRREAGSTMQAPEIDPASMVAALSLLSGGLLVMRGRRGRG